MFPEHAQFASDIECVIYKYAPEFQASPADFKINFTVAFKKYNSRELRCTIMQIFRRKS
jgi:hypothetical protein